MLCAKQIVVVLFCFGRHTGRMDRQRERERRESEERKQTWLWPKRLYRRHSCSLWRISGRRRPGPRRADCWPGPPRQSGLRLFVIMAGNRDPEPLLPVCKSRASHFIFFSNFFQISRIFEGGGSGHSADHSKKMEISQEAIDSERTHTQTRREKKNPK